MKKVIIQRFKRGGITYGKFMMDWALEHKPLFTLELPWKDNATDISCIPAGLYNVAAYSSQRYPNTFEIKSVPGRTKILIHVGNYTRNTQGCILLGLGINEGSDMITNSRNAIEYLHSQLSKGDTFPFALEIKD